MTGRDTAFALGAIVVAIAIATILLVGSMAAGADAAGRTRPFFFVNFSGRVTQPIRAAGAGDVPVPLRAVVPLQRGVSNTARDAAGYLLLVIGVSAVLVLGREQVLGAYHAARGTWRDQLRVLGTGLAVLLLLASASFLGGVVLVGGLAAGFREAPTGIQFGLQVGLMTMAVFAAALLLVALIGFAAASWRLGDAIFGLRAMSRWSGGIPGPLVALIGATILYVLMQLPAVGGLVALAVISYALGAVVIARLGPSALPAPTSR
ncbi:MAG TPA: hypothetical protein VGT60_12425 [Candidatus Limnocylindria bacterium]|nr:hypothetical protein [Candidatus Limnocylindria bacterium]